MTLREIDCAPSKDGGLTVSLHLQADDEGVETDESTKKRRRRRRRMTSEQMLELAHTAITAAMQADEPNEQTKHYLLGAAAGRGGGERTQRRIHWPG